MAGRRRSDRALRDKLRSPGRPGVASREKRRRFWAFIAEGLSSEDAAMKVEVSQPVGSRWFRVSGGLAPSHLARSSKPLSERSLSFAEREEIALLRAQGAGVREVARRLGRAASTLFARAEAERGDARRQPGLSGDHGTVARGARGASTKTCEAGVACAVAVLCAGASRRPRHSPGWGRGERAGGALEGTAPWAAPASAMGKGLEPTADRRPASVRLPG
jgi:transposase-like protein